jgi:hypothetical protein
MLGDALAATVCKETASVAVGPYVVESPAGRREVASPLKVETQNEAVEDLSFWVAIVGSSLQYCPLCGSVDAQRHFTRACDYESFFYAT